eukprot:m.104319 g.104319  ORF g.104319 m.104319 type:complete len:312 (+) comp51590_c0_seq8:258-1193(+)
MSVADAVFGWGIVLANVFFPSLIEYIANRPRKIEISQLFIYPIKSCAPIPVSSSHFDRLGFLWDRRWLVVRRSNERSVTQLESARMALITPSISGPSIRLNAPGMPELQLPLTHTWDESCVHVQVANEEITAVTVSAESDAWFSTYLGIDVRLVRVPPFENMFAQSRRHDMDESDLSDTLPFLLMAEESVNELNSRLPSPDRVSVLNFRPNIVVRGCRPYEEDKWRVVTIGGIKFDFVAPCTQCAVSNIDQQSGVCSETMQPLKVLRQYRARNSKVYLGQTMIQRTTHGSLAVSMPVAVEIRSECSNLDEL